MLVFPYGHDCEPIIRHSNLLDQGCRIVALISPGGWGLAGKSIKLGNSEISLTVRESLQEVTEEFDTLYIPAFDVVEKVENRLVNQMVKLIPHLMHVYCAARLTNTNLNKLEDTCRQVSPICTFENLSEQKTPEAYDLSMPTENYPSLHPLDVPVVIVAGLWEKTDKFEISLALRERLLKNGYRVTQIGSRDGCEMLGFHSFPGFMFRKDVDAADKVIHFNRWIIQVAEREQPDLLLLTIPGAVQDFNEQFTRGFGLLHHQVFKAVAPDVLIMCMFFSFDPKEFLKEISESCRYRFGTPIDVFHISNLFIDITSSEEVNRVVTINVYREIVSEMLSKRSAASPIPMFNALEPADCDRMFDVIIKKLIPKDVQAVFLNSFNRGDVRLMVEEQNMIVAPEEVRKEIENLLNTKFHFPKDFATKSKDYPFFGLHGLLCPRRMTYLTYMPERQYGIRFSMEEYDDTMFYSLDGLSEIVARLVNSRA